jgi:signal transduction histidine kinase
MSLPSALACSAALVVLYVACFHVWIWYLRPSERENLWLGVAAAAIAGFGACAGMLYASETVTEGVFWQRAMMVTSIPLVLGFFRFTSCFLGIEGRRAEAFWLGYAVLAAAIAVRTDWMFDGAATLRSVPLLGMAWVESGLRPFGQLMMAGYLPAFVHLIGRYGKHLHAGATEVRTLFVTVCLWFLAALSDAAVGVGLHEAPYLLAFGYLAIVLGISSIVIRRFVHSADELAHLNETLHERVEARTEELRQKELQLAHGERLATIGTLAASVAHEINNPIAFVQSNLNRLGELWRKPESSEDVEDILLECREGTERVRAIVSELLTLARRGDGRTDEVDLHEVISSVLPVVRKFARHRAALVTDLRGVPRLRGDARLLGQVVLNLLMNSLQAIPEGNAERNRVSVSTWLENGAAWLAVSDTGPGIPAEHRARIFDPFFTSKPDGTGLGLAVSQQIVLRHHGRIHVQTDDTGTRMLVEFPEAALAEASGDDAPSGQP